MNKREFKKFVRKELREIDIHKYIESQKAGYNKGEEAARQWVKDFALIFRSAQNIRDLKSIRKDLKHLVKKNGIKKKRTTMVMMYVIDKLENIIESMEKKEAKNEK